jgi:hypothetical protein
MMFSFPRSSNFHFDSYTARQRWRRKELARKHSCPVLPLSAGGRKFYVPTIITDGQALGDALKGFKSLTDSSVERNIVVWLNEYFRVIERDGRRAYGAPVSNTAGYTIFVRPTLPGSVPAA